MTTLRATYWWAYGPLIGIASIAPALLDQGSVDDRAAAWQLLGVWAIASLAVSSQVMVRPVLATCLSFAVLGAAELVASARELELSFLDIVPVAVCLFMTGALASRRGVVGAIGFVGVVTCGGVVANRLTAPPESQGGTDVLAGLLTMVLALLGGFAVRAHREAAQQSAQQYEAERRARARAGVEATRRERLRIAREMHDLVAHSVTLLVVNAETLRARRSELPRWAADQADAMAEAGRRAAVEMREMLHVLRDETQDDEPAGQPSLADIPSLVAEARRAGMVVELSESGTARALDEQTGLCAYRVVQEGLSNARRHGPDAAAAIALRWRSSDLVVEVTSSGAPGAAPRPAGAPGLGLAGLRERAVEVGGELVVEQTDREFRTRARLPISAGAAPAPAAGTPR